MVLPTIRWGILGTGWISTNFVKDLVLHRPDTPVHHIVQAIGTSSVEKGTDFVHSVLSNDTEGVQQPKVYTSYADVYADPDVDIVYVGTPHALHKINCLDAIAAGKHVLCEKPFTINAKEAEEVIAAARAKGVYIMEAVWTRFFPIILSLQKRLHDSEKPIIGTIHRLFCDFGLAMNLSSLPDSSRLKNLALGAGALLDVGIYPLTLASVLLNGGLPNAVESDATSPNVTASLIVRDGIDISDAITLRFEDPDRFAILTASLEVKTPSGFMRIEGSKGSVVVEGPAASYPTKATIVYTDDNGGQQTEVLEPKHTGIGFFFEADAVALDIAAGRQENEIMPLAETVRMMRLMDDIRRTGGVLYPQDQSYIVA